MYKINEIFYSLQGEGRWSGTPAIFVRFSFCNLKCSFCDTEFSEYKEMSLDDIKNEIIKYPSKHIILTGGEPTLQIDNELIDMLRDEDYYIAIESNGTNKIIWDIDWITISPKENWTQKEGDELKVIYEGQDIKPYYEDSCFSYYYLQACSMKNIDEIIMICKENPEWSMSTQLQKILKIR